MKSPLSSIFAIMLSLVAVFTAILICTLVFVITTERGTQFVWQRTQPFLAESIEIHTIKGRLMGPLQVGGLKVTTETFNLEIDLVELDWRPSRLIRRLLEVDNITVEGMRIIELQTSAPKTKEESKPFTLPEEIELPLDIRLGKVSLQNFEFHSQAGTEPFIIDTAMLSAIADSQRVALSSIKINGPLFTVDGNVSLMTDRTYLLDGDLHWQIPVPDYPTLTGQTLLHGSLHALTITQSISAPYDLQAVALLRNPLSDLAFEIDLAVNPMKLQKLNEDLPPITVHLEGTAKGNPNDIEFNLNGWVEDSEFGRFNAALTGDLKAQTITIDDLKISVKEQPAQLKAAGKVELAGAPIFDVEANWDHLQWPLKGDPLITSSQGTMTLTGTPENLHSGIDMVVGSTGRILGSADWKNHVFNVAMDWHHLQWPLIEPEVQSPKGHIAATGTIEEYIFDMNARLKLLEQADAELLLKGQGSQEALDLTRIELTAQEGKLKGIAKLNWSPELQAAVELEGQDLNPGVILKEWPGELAISLRAQGGVAGNKPHLQLEHLFAEGQLRGYELSLDAAGAYAENLTTLQRVALSSGSTQIEASGTISDTFDFNWKVHSDDLGTLLPNATGSIAGRGSLSGPVKRPRVIAQLTAEQISYADYLLQSLNLNGDVDLTGDNKSWMSLLAEEGSGLGIELKKMTLDGQGNPNAHAVTLAMETNHGQADIDLQGVLHNPWEQDISWNFRLNQARFSYPGLEGWVLQSPTTGSIAAAQVQLSKSCWQSDEAQLCLQGNKFSEEATANFELTDLPFTYFARYLPPDMTLQGSLSGRGTLGKSGNKNPTANINLTTTKARVLSRNVDEELQEEDMLVIELEPGDISLLMQQDRIVANMELPLSKTDGFALHASISPGDDPLMKRPLQGHITTEIENLVFIADLIPEVQELYGKLRGDITLTGNLTSPVLNGDIALVEGMAKLERPGLDLKDIRITLKGDGDRGVQLKAHAASGSGDLDITGIAKLHGKATEADFKVKGNNFRIINTLEADVDASPDLIITLRGERVDVEGEVVFPRAQIKLKTLSDSAVKVSNDQVIVVSGDQERTTEQVGREVHARVRFVLGDEVYFDGFGLNARIEGKILAVEAPGEPTTGSGELNILDGEYRAYGQGLIVEKGRILFAGGPISQPGLDVRAVRRPEQDILVGVQVRGNLREPDFTLYSQPTMTQSNQLSYLVIGRPLRGASTTEGSALSRAALALGLKGGNQVAEKIGGKLGVDQFGIDSGEAGSDTSPENASFVVGKYLSPKLYVSYGLGLFDPVSTVRLQYALSSRWEFVTESSSVSSGGDIIYTIERGK